MPLKMIWHRSRKVVLFDSSRLLLVMSSTYLIPGGEKGKGFKFVAETSILILFELNRSTIETSLGQGIPLMRMQTNYVCMNGISKPLKLPENVLSSQHAFPMRHASACRYKFSVDSLFAASK